MEQLDQKVVKLQQDIAKAKDIQRALQLERNYLRKEQGCLAPLRASEEAAILKNAAKSFPPNRCEDILRLLQEIHTAELRVLELKERLQIANNDIERKEMGEALYFVFSCSGTVGK